jgi:protein SCO1/2
MALNRFSLAGALVLAMLVSLTSGTVRAQELPSLGSAPSFQFTDSTGQQFDSNSLRGTVWILSFFFTNCPAICPAIQGRVAGLYKLFDGERDFRIVSISVDPGNDTPEKLAEYARTFEADPKRWIFLTGEDEAVKRVAREGFKLNPGETPEQHNTRVVLVDKDYQIRGYFQGTEAEGVNRLRASVRSLLP